MDEARKKLADFERNWGGLFRWLASIVFLAGVWGLVIYARHPAREISVE
jgi:hypothetical protein